MNAPDSRLRSGVLDGRSRYDCTGGSVDDERRDEQQLREAMRQETQGVAILMEFACTHLELQRHAPLFSWYGGFVLTLGIGRSLPSRSRFLAVIKCWS
jgi:hypothetical protein